MARASLFWEFLKISIFKNKIMWSCTFFKKVLLNWELYKIDSASFLDIFMNFPFDFSKILSIKVIERDCDLSEIKNLSFLDLDFFSKIVVFWNIFFCIFSFIFYTFFNF